MSQASVITLHPLSDIDWTDLGPIRVAVIDVTPDLATRWLLLNDPENRSCHDSDIAPFARDMANDAWQFTHQGICFNAEHLIDGQTRLNAIVMSGRAQRMLVCQREDASVHDSVDTHRKRTLAFLLQRTPKAVAVANVLRNLRSGRRDTSRSTLGDAKAIFDVFSENFAGLQTAVPDYLQLPVGCLAACIFAWPLNPKTIGDFAARVADGAMIGPGDPAYTYRAWRDRVSEQAWAHSIATMTCIRAVLSDERLEKIHTGVREGNAHRVPSAYRVICTWLRAAKVSYAPSTEAAPTLSRKSAQE